MSNVFKVEIVNPEKSFLIKDDVTEVVVPAFEGEMGILKDHISIITFLIGIFLVVGVTPITSILTEKYLEVKSSYTKNNDYLAPISRNLIVLNNNKYNDSYKKKLTAGAQNMCIFCQNQQKQHINSFKFFI